MVNINAEPPQGREEHQQLRTSGRFSIPFIQPPQGLAGGVGPIFGEMLFENGKTMLFEKSPDTIMLYEGNIDSLWITNDADKWVTNEGDNWKE